MRRLKEIGKGLVLVVLSTLMEAMPVVAKSNTCIPDNTEIINQTAETDEEDDLILVCSSSKTINDITFSVSFSRRADAKDTTDENVKILEKLFYEVYPQMYDRFGGYKKAPTNIKVEFVNELQNGGLCYGDTIYLKDEYYNADKHFDAFTHELAHSLQHWRNETNNNLMIWDRSKLEYDNYVETFADYCRFVYGFNNGEFNDKHWILQDKYNQTSREKSVRFLVWLDWETTSSNKDIIRDFFEICSDGKYSREQWKDTVWPILFKGTRFEGRSIDDVWHEYDDCDFSHYGSKSTEGRTPEIIRKCKKGNEDIRTYLKNHSFSQKYEESL